MDTTVLMYIAGAFVVLIIIGKVFLNRPSKTKKEFERQRSKIKGKYSDKYNEVRPLDKDKKKYNY